jgi:glycosyltransferase involved in cell wall biosynthesis
MKIGVVIPAHNEAEQLTDCLQSFVDQQRRPDQLILIDDNSSDQTLAIAQHFSRQYDFITVFGHRSSDQHLPGAKVIQAFKRGKQELDTCDLIGKFDADIVLPPPYFAEIEKAFKNDNSLALAGGLLYVLESQEWVYESISKKDHIRGPIKLYRTKALEEIGGLVPQRGWDNADRWMLEAAGYTTRVLPQLKVKHLRPTGRGYSVQRTADKGRVLGQLRYDPLLAVIACFKTARQGPNSFRAFFQLYRGYWNGFLGQNQLVNKAQGKYIRRKRWQGVWQTLSAKQH